MSDPQLDLHHLKTFDEAITTILQDYHTLHERTINTLQTMTQNLRGDELWPTDVTGPVVMLQRTYNERRGQLDAQWRQLLARRSVVVFRQIMFGEQVGMWEEQRAFTKAIVSELLPGLLELEMPLLRRDQTVSTSQTREFYTTVIANLQAIARAFVPISELWQAVVELDWGDVSESRFAVVIEPQVTIRREPTLRSERVGILQHGTRLKVQWLSPRDENGVRWYFVMTDGGKGWVRQDLLQLGDTHPAASTPAESSIHRREEMSEQSSQQQSAAPPTDEPMPEPIEVDKLDEEDFTGGEPIEPAPPPPAPIIVPAEPATTERLEPEKQAKWFDDEMTAPGYAPPKPTPNVTPASPEKKKAESSPAPTVIEPTHFTAYAPKEVPPETWANLSAYIFRESAHGAVENDAKQKFGAALADMRHGKAAALAEIQEGATITAAPRMDGFTFNPESLSLKFVKPYHRFDFEMMAGRERLNLASNGAITFSMGGVLIGEIPLSVFVGERATIEIGVVQAEPYQKIFCSYSHRDTRVVERVERAYRVLGFDYLRDVTRLRSGQQWNAELMRWIDEAHIFQLFWSAAAAHSPYVEQEWRHALQMTRPNFIRPVYWKKPLVAPPSELGKLHFAYDPQIQGAGWWNKVIGLVRG